MFFDYQNRLIDLESKRLDLERGQSLDKNKIVYFGVVCAFIAGVVVINKDNKEHALNIMKIAK